MNVIGSNFAFSATMIDSVDELVKMFLDKPVRLFVGPKRITTCGFVQGSVRVSRKGERRPAILDLCKRSLTMSSFPLQQETRSLHADSFQFTGNEMRGTA